MQEVTGWIDTDITEATLNRVDLVRDFQGPVSPSVVHSLLAGLAFVALPRQTRNFWLEDRRYQSLIAGSKTCGYRLKLYYKAAECGSPYAAGIVRYEATLRPKKRRSRWAAHHGGAEITSLVELGADAASQMAHDLFMAAGFGINVDSPDRVKAAVLGRLDFSACVLRGVVGYLDALRLGVGTRIDADTRLMTGPQ